MLHTDYDVDGLARYLHVAPSGRQNGRAGDAAGPADRRQLCFAKGEIHHWLEERIGSADELDLQKVQGLLDQAAQQAEPATVRISELMPREAIAIPLAARTRNSVITAMVELAAATGLVWDPQQMAEAVKDRENLHPTALDNGVALLHPRRPLGQILGQPLLALGRTHQGLPFGSAGGQLTDLFFLICSVDDSQHLRTLARLSRLISAEGFVPALRAAADAETVLLLVKDYEDQLDRQP